VALFALTFPWANRLSGLRMVERRILVRYSVSVSRVRDLRQHPNPVSGAEMSFGPRVGQDQQSKGHLLAAT